MAWEEDAGAYKKVELQKQPKPAEISTPEQKYWRKFKTVTMTQAYAAVHSVSFSPGAPYDLAVTNSTRVQIYGVRGKAPKKTISRFKDVVYCASFRQDGKLLACGGEEKDVKIMETGSGGLLRMLKGHTRAVHACQFTPHNKHLATGGDDQIVKYWDVSAGHCLLDMEGHTDHVRCMASNPASADLLATGSYDHTVKLWDTRLGSTVLSVTHGDPVQAVVMLPGGGVMVTAGGTSMKVWDVLSGGRLLQTVCNHSKPITCLAVDAEGGRVLSGSLDHQLKVYNVQEYKVLYSLDYTQPILSAAVAPDGMTVAVGMASGLLAVRGRGTKTGKSKADEAQRAKKPPQAGTFQYFIRGQSGGAEAEDFKVERVRKQRLAPYDRMLKAFSYGAALDAALETNNPEVVASVLHELALRDSMSIALSGRDEEGLLPLLRFVCKHITNQAYSALMTDTAHLILELYTVVIGRSEAADELLWKLRGRVREQLALDADLVRLQGSLELVLSASMHTRAVGAG